jgi:hypothetical protein
MLFQQTTDVRHYHDMSVRLAWAVQDGTSSDVVSNSSWWLLLIKLLF